MARFNLYLLERPRRWTDALRERVRSAATPSSREAVEAFLQGTSEGPVLLAADDNPAKVTALWEQCHRDGLAVCIFDHSTVWDRLRDRLRALRGRAVTPAVTPAATPAATPVAPPAATPSPAPAARREETALRDPGAFALGPRARAVVLAVGAFVTLVAVAASVVPEALRETNDVAAQASEMPGGGGRGSLRASSGSGSAAATRSATPNGLPRGADTAALERDGRDVTSPNAEVTAASREAAAESPRAHPARLLAAFALGVALAWIAGLTLSKRTDPAHLRSGGMVMMAFCALVVLTAGLSRLAALSSARPPDASSTEALPEALPDTLPEALPEDARAPEALGPFARLLRRHRGAAAPPARSLRSLLSHWRTTHSDAGEAPDVAAPEPPPARPADRHHRRHRRHEDRRHARHDAPRAGMSDAAATALADAVTDDAPARDDASRDTPDDAPTTRAAAAPSQPPAAPSPPTAPQAAREGAASAGAPGARTDTPRRPRAVVPRPPPPRRPPPPHSPWAALALGVMVGMLTSPRWRAVAKGAL